MGFNNNSGSWSGSGSWPTGGGFSSGNRKVEKKATGTGKRHSDPVASVPVQATPEIEGIDPSQAKTPADLARFFADGVRQHLGEFWEAPYWVRAWFSDKTDWVFVTTLPNGPSWEIAADAQLWVKVITRFFEADRRDPAIGKSGSALWNEFKYFAQHVDLLEERVVKIGRQELSAKTKILAERALVHGVVLDTESERKARAAMFAAEEAILDARAHGHPRKTLDRLQRALEVRQKELHVAVHESYEWLREQGLAPEDLMQEHSERKRYVGMALSNVSGLWKADRQDEKIAEGRPLIKDPDARQRARKAEKRALDEYMASDEGKEAVEAEIARLAASWDRIAAARFALQHPSEDDVREVASWDEEEDGNPESGKQLMESLDIEGTAKRLKAKLAESIKQFERESNEEHE